MADLSSLSDAELVRRLPGLVRAERHAMVDVIEHLVEVERRRLYMTSRITSLLGYCMEKLGYDEDSALKRHRVAKLALRFPQVLDELRAGTMHLTGLVVASEVRAKKNAIGFRRGAGRRLRPGGALAANGYPTISDAFARARRFALVFGAFALFLPDAS